MSATIVNGADAYLQTTMNSGKKGYDQFMFLVNRRQ